MISEIFIMKKFARERQFWIKEFNRQRTDYIRGILRGISIACYLLADACKEYYILRREEPLEMNEQTCRQLYGAITKALGFFGRGDRARGIRRLEDGIANIQPKGATHDGKDRRSIWVSSIKKVSKRDMLSMHETDTLGGKD